MAASVCLICKEPAVVYCHEDLCSACDLSIHTANAVASRHVRTSIDIVDLEQIEDSHSETRQNVCCTAHHESCESEAGLVPVLRLEDNIVASTAELEQCWGKDRNVSWSGNLILYRQHRLGRNFHRQNDPDAPALAA